MLNTQKRFHRCRVGRVVPLPQRLEPALASEIPYLHGDVVSLHLPHVEADSWNHIIHSVTASNCKSRTKRAFARVAQSDDGKFHFLGPKGVPEPREQIAHCKRVEVEQRCLIAANEYFSNKAQVGMVWYRSGRYSSGEVARQEGGRGGKRKRRSLEVTWQPIGS